MANIKVTWNEELFTAAGDRSRGTVKVKENQGRLYALIGSRWCRCDRREDGKLIEIWVR